MEILEKISTCVSCGKQFKSNYACCEILGTEITLSTNLCDECQEEKERQIAMQSAGPKLERLPWEEICPKVYQHFDRTKLPPKSQRAASQAFEWQNGSRGIGLFGQSRTGKTFILHELMRRHYEAGASVCLTSSTDFAYAMGSPDQAERRGAIDRAIKVDLLLLDDIGKEKMTNRVESDLYHVFEQRRRALKPVFTSVNSDGQSLAGAMSDDAGWPIVNRLKFDLCEFTSIQA